MHIVIVGNGIAGISAARMIRKHSDHRITVVSGETEHHFSRTALMYIYMGHLTYEGTQPYEKGFWAKNRIDLAHAWALALDTSAQTLALSDGRTLKYDALLLATGSRPRSFGWPGVDLGGVQGLYAKSDLDAMEQATRGMEHGAGRAVVVGGGLIGIEMAEMLHTRHIPTTFLVREDSYMSHVLPPEESEMVRREIVRHGIDLRLGEELERLEGDEDGRVREIVTKHSGERVRADFVGLTIGVTPNLDLAQNGEIECDRGILVDEYLRTSAPNVYAAGDCAQHRDAARGHMPVEQLWYTGRTHGLTVGMTLAGSPTPYRKGVFFNSAKFFTLEYQTYGDIRAQRPESRGTRYWEHAGGLHSVRLDYDRASRRVVGFNLMGIRFRHDVCERWLREGRTLEYVIEHLREADFDPEFTPDFARSAARAFA